MITLTGGPRCNWGPPIRKSPKPWVQSKFQIGKLLFKLAGGQRPPLTRSLDGPYGSNPIFCPTDDGSNITGAIDEWRELRGAARGLAEPQADSHDGADGTRAGAPGDRVHDDRRSHREHLLVGGGVGAQREAQRDRAPAAAALRHRELCALRGMC